MRAIKKLGRLVSVTFVVLFAVVVGLFLSACRTAELDSSARSTAPDPAESTAAEQSTTSTAVDVDETENAQPVPRNLLE